MRKLHILTWVVVLLCCYSCKKDKTTESENSKQAAATQSDQGGYTAMTYNVVIDTNLVPIDTVNRMIRSYLRSLDGEDDNLRSLILNAETLREYLKDSSIKEVKLMFAHTQSYMNSGHEGQPVGLKSNALTIVLAGYRADGTYVLSQGYKVPDRARPCPTSCPLVGSASKDVIE
ncbi:hypothetical protein [Taibaiella chishuiensis]|uniref:Uncharacterized protein n=1 Tax=Taibaiella chishuiensis TaxID=1434707 RepID=A0A2P8CXK7_9BACT|nr:hypothetical protein [Taibaiella chishuiensis]PSK89704.1 hypothetical protein B0I18_1103 [Taibaiella chishuiensis]